jgi:hypothetical protein
MIAKRKRKQRTEKADSAEEPSSVDCTDFVFPPGEEINDPIVEPDLQGFAGDAIEGKVIKRAAKGRRGVKKKPATAKAEIAASERPRDAPSSKGLGARSGRDPSAACWEAMSGEDVLTPPASIEEVAHRMRTAEETKSAEGPCWEALE